VAEKHEEWRILTPILLGVLTIIVLPVMGWLMSDKLTSMETKTDKLFGVVSQVKTSFDDYKVTAENRFTRLETELADMPRKDTSS